MNPRSRLQILVALVGRGRAGWGELLDAQDASLPEFHATLHALHAAGELVLEGGFASLTAKGREALGKDWLPLRLRCAACQGKGHALRVDSAVSHRLEKLLVDRPQPNLDYDQGAITPADALLRAAFLEERGDLLDRDVLMVGDFDLVSLALALTGQPRRVLVLDIDERVVAFVNAAAAREGLRVEAGRFDVRQPLPDPLLRAFDVFVCDPVETLAGISLYLSRGAAALRGAGGAAYFGLTTLEASLQKWFDVQGLLHQMGFALTDARRRFSSYPDHDQPPAGTAYAWPVLERLGTDGVGHRWYTSAFLRAEAVRTPEPLVTGPAVLEDDLYVDGEAWATPRSTA